MCNGLKRDFSNFANLGKYLYSATGFGQPADNKFPYKVIYIVALLNYQYPSFDAEFYEVSTYGYHNH